MPPRSELFDLVRSCERRSWSKEDRREAARRGARDGSGRRARHGRIGPCDVVQALHGRQGRQARRARRVGAPGRRHQHHRAVRCLARALRRQVRDHPWSRAARAAATPSARSSARRSACGARTRIASPITGPARVDLFNLDRVDFFYNTSAPLSQFFWGEDETLRRITRIIRTTQPEIYIGFTPSLAAGHGNHQQAGRYIWEGVKAAADPTMFPEQLRGPNALRTWQVKKVFSGGSVPQPSPPAPAARRRRRTAPPGSSRRGLDTVAGVWTGYDSPYLWPPGNVQGQPGGLGRSRWAQVARRGRARLPDPEPRDVPGRPRTPGCSALRHDRLVRAVPAELNAGGDAEPGRRQDDAILYGAVKRDPGGLPLGTLEYMTFSRFFNAPGAPFEATVHVRVGARDAPARQRRADASRRAGRSTPAEARSGRSRARRESTVTFDVTPARRRGRQHELQDLRAATRPAGRPATRTTSCAWSRPSRAASSAGASGRSTTTGSLNTAPRALRIGRSPAAQSMGDRRDDHRPGRGPQLVGRAADRHRRAGAAGRLHRRRRLEALRHARAGRGRDGRVRSSRTPTRRCPRARTRRSRSRRPTARRRRLRQREPDVSLVPTTTIPEAAARAGASTAPRARASTAGPRSTSAGAGRAPSARPAGVDCGTSRDASATPRRAPTPRSPATATPCTSSCTCATTSRATPSRRRSASRTGSPTRSRS